MTINKPKLLCLAIATTLISGCGANPRKAIFNNQSPEMATLLGSTSSKPVFGVKAVGRQESLDYNGYAHKGENVFKELSNPTLILYVDAHKTENGTYVPGVVIPYKLYEKVEFALPGEL